MKEFAKKKILIPFIILVFIVSFAAAGCAAGITGADLKAAETKTALLEAPATTADGEDGISYVSVDINPSIRLILQNGVVTEAGAFNDDGSEILITTPVVNMTAEQAIETLINAFSQQGYLSAADTDASLVITVCGENQEGILTNLETKAQESLTALGLQCNVVAQTIKNEVVNEAAKYGLSAGRYMLLQYLAKQENITMEAAVEKYGTMKMGKLLELIGSSDLVFDDLIAEELTPEQRALLKQAKDAYKAAMKTAHKALVKTKNEAQKYFQKAKKDAQNAFKGNDNHDTWEQIKTDLQKQFKLQQEAAFKAFNQAREQARLQFMAAVENLRLKDEVIAQYLAWDEDLDWDFDFNWEEAAPAPSPAITPENNNAKGNGKKN
ncbi:MAG: anti-sigma-I factor RsgI family protein [Christensenellales bacterium]